MNELKRILEGLKPGEVLTRVYSPEVRLLDKANRVFRFVASTRGVDSYKTRLIDWDYKRYMDNPVVLFSHNPFLPPVARTIKLEDDGDKVRADIQFPPKGLYEFADTLYNLTEADFLRGISVGFRHGRAQPNPEMKCIDLYDNELNELSLVGVPSNPKSLAEAVRSGQIPEQYQDLFVANKAAQIQNLKGVSDIEALRAQVESWRASPTVDVIEVRSDDDDDDTPLTTDELLARCSALTTMAEEIQLELDSTQEKLRLLTEENEALKTASEKEDQPFYIDAVRSIAAIVEVDVKDAYTKEELIHLASEVQGRCIRIGASLSKRNRDLLRSVVATIEEILGSGMDEGGDPTATADDPTPDRSTTADEQRRKHDELQKIAERMKALEKRVQAIRTIDARELAADQDTDDGDQMLTLVRGKIAGLISGNKG